MDPNIRKQLIRLRWAVRAVLVAGTAVSVGTNILHALPNPISQAIAAWPPLALLLTVELVSRIPTTGAMRSWVRVAGTATIAGVAAWISYWHMVGTVAGAGETGASPYLWPLTVDGIIVVASVSLVELSLLLRTPTNSKPPVTTAAPDPVVASAAPLIAAVEQAVAPAIPARNVNAFWGAKLGKGRMPEPIPE